MLLQHAVRFHEARDWIHLQDQNQLTYASLLQHCKTLEQRCEQYQKAQIKGRAELTTLSAASSHRISCTSRQCYFTQYPVYQMWIQAPS